MKLHLTDAMQEKDEILKHFPCVDFARTTALLMVDGLILANVSAAPPVNLLIALETWKQMWPLQIYWREFFELFVDSVVWP